MARFTYSQLEGLWIQAGGSRARAPLMAAIAEAESGGDPGATGGVGEKGLWQINPHAWGSLATYDPLGNARAAVHILGVQGLSAWSTYTNGDYRAFLNTSTTPAAVSGGTGGGSTGQAPGTTTAAGRGSGTGAVSAAEAAAAQRVANAVATIAASDQCAWQIGKVEIPITPFGGHLGVGGWCVLSKSNVRALVSGGIIVGGLALFTAGIIMLSSTTSFGQAIVGTVRKAATVAAVA